MRLFTDLSQAALDQYFLKNRRHLINTQRRMSSHMH